MKKVLVVEDDTDVSSNIKYMLTKTGYTILVANDGAQGITMAKDNLPDLIIMDLMLPGIQGGDVVSTIKKHPPCKDIPAILLTGLMSNKEESEGINTILINGRQYPAFPKPFDFPQLLKVIENFLK